MTRIFASLLLTIAAGTAWCADYYKDGARLLAAGRYAEAARSFEHWLLDHPRDADAAALCGIAKFHAGEHAAAVRSLELGRAGKTRYGARTLYYLGLAYSSLGDATRSRDAFAALHTQYPTSAEAAKVDRSVDAVHPTTPDRHRDEPLSGFARALSWFRLVVIANAGYDSNPYLDEDPGDVALQKGRTFLFNYGSLRLDVPKTPLFVEAQMVNYDYFGDDANDYRSHRGRAGLDFHFGRAWKLTPRYDYEQAYLGHEYFLTRQQGTVRASFIAGPWQATLAPYGVQRRYDELFEHLDGEEFGVDASLSYRVNAWLKQIRLSARAAQRETEVERFGYDEYAPRLNIRFGLPWRFDLDLSGEYRLRQYAEANLLTGVTREDERISASARLTRPLTTWLTLELSAEHNDNDSNVDAQDYEQDVYSGGFVIVL
jgi:tetratricopeptide (TPR) repeat protein